MGSIETPKSCLTMQAGPISTTWKVLILFVILATFNVQKCNTKATDTDLIFDEPQALNEEPWTQTAAKTKKTVSPLSPDYPLDDVVDEFDADIDEPQDKEQYKENKDKNDDSSNWLMQKVKRFRRQISEMLNGSGSSKLAVKPKAVEEGKPKKLRKSLKRFGSTTETTMKPTKKSKRSKSGKLVKGKDSRLKRQFSHTYNDDDEEDDDDDDEDDDEIDNGINGLESGSGIDPGEERQYRVKFVVREPWTNEFYDTRSRAFTDLANDIRTGIEELYEQHFYNEDERIFVTVTEIAQTDDSFKVEVSADITASAGVSASSLNEIFRRQIRDYHTIGETPAELNDRYQFTPIEDGPLHNPHNHPSPSSSNTESPAGFGYPICDGNEVFRCYKSQHLICKIQRCDHIPDCPNGEDEENCEDVCEADELSCDINRCIPLSHKCDGTPDCADHKDELDCPTRDDHHRTPLSNRYPEHNTESIRSNLICTDNKIFQCNISKEEICYNHRCNGYPDCPHGEDEENCIEVCEHNEFLCDVNRCIPLLRKCDGKIDCADETDETKDCSNQDAWPTTVQPNESSIEGYFDHTTKSLDLLCSNSDTFMCHTSGLTICDSQRCNGHSDCPNGEDERHCDNICEPDDFLCDVNRCVPLLHKCDGKINCADRTDEIGCPQEDDSTTPDAHHSFVAPKWSHSYTTEYPIVDLNCNGSGMFKCYHSGQMVCNSQRCNGRSDCPQGEDEENCYQICEDNEFLCDHNRCVRTSRKCDGKIDCADRSDEKNCPIPVCEPNEFSCDGNRCISINNRCNGKIDCADLKDELNCDNNLVDHITTHRPPSYEPPHIPQPHDTSPIFDGLLCTGDDAFECYKSGQEICKSKRCDQILDCPHGEDEDFCDAVCGVNEISCDGNRCLPISMKCNNRIDCADQSDEANCSDHHHLDCHPEEFQCDNHQCIPRNLKCNGYPDCLDGSDERQCTNECKIDERRCNDEMTCIHNDQVCDGITDCPSGDDEQDCNSDVINETDSNCAHDEYECQDGTCIPIELRCNSYPDCYDEDDEYGCPPNEVSCRQDEFDCGGGYCITSRYVCDGTHHCLNGADEHDCENSIDGPCGADQWQCDNGHCINKEFLCDETRDCHDGSDEAYKTCVKDDHRATMDDCTYDEFFCDNSCQSRSIVCNGHIDCLDRRDEYNCPSTTPTPYPTNHYHHCPELQCPGSHKCYRYSEKCDRTSDCDDGYDESDCCSDNEFRCNDGNCVARSAVCDGRYQCADASDETSCPSGPTQPTHRCASFEWQCDNGDCINSYSRCDGRPDCRDYSDEKNCRATSPTSSGDPQLDLKTYPNEQTIKESREVVFRCRDEGPNRAPVRWTRPGGRPLPPGSADKNGRLEIPNIRVEDSGEYVCEAVGHAQHIQGQSVMVHLTVEKYNPIVDRPQSACGYHQSTCMNGDCIAKNQICDGIPHCADGSDEHGCSRLSDCEPNQFKCKNTKCVDRVWRCDGDNDCGDNSDEDSCDPNPTGSPCRYDEYQCRNGQCVPKTFHCDGTSDCQDGSDEVGCRAPEVVEPPPPLVNLPVGGVLNITCRAVGTPPPVIVWRLNWGHVPEKCVSTNQQGVGVLTCGNMQTRDSGAYSCEIINTKGRVFVTPDTIVTVVSDEPDVCPAGFFNSLASKRDECINCFCFGVANQCKSANLYIYSLDPPVTSQQVLGVELPQNGHGDLKIGQYSGHNLMVLRHGIQFRASDIPYTRESPYLALPTEYKGNQLKSYGGYMKYEVQFIGHGQPTDAPDIILIGNGYVLSHRSKHNIQPHNRNHISAQFVPGNWLKTDNRQASREEIMMALAGVENILLRLQYTDSSEREVELLHITMDSAAVDNRGLGSASLVEQCACPVGYIGYSCETCAPGYVRQRGGAWLGRCVPEPPPICPDGYYGDPSRGIQCQRCPCPLTNAENNFAHSCNLEPNGEVTCHCQRGYTGTRCEHCEPGYHGEPMIPGGRCTSTPIPGCDPRGTLETVDRTCKCKDHVTGLYCDKCLPTSFHLNDFSPSGCIECFCMGITTQCSSSQWHRDTVQSRFSGGWSEHGFSLISDYETPIPSNLQITQRADKLSFYGRPDDSDVLYWSLPPKFLGDKVTAYGGDLNYTIEYSPQPGGLMSKNNAPDVVIKSDNDIVLLHHRKGEVFPRKPQTYAIPIIEIDWQRADGRSANREYLLMALADISAIYIKATYTTVTEEASLNHVSLDTATQANIGTQRAVEVEQCACPAGYTGLSCEDCAPGYKRSEEGLYLGVCDPCECNGHSNECDAESGKCFGCRDNTGGDYCELCAPGFYGNATQGTPYDCRPDSGESSVLCSHCDARGTSSCSDGHCRCKENVLGSNCDYCRQGTFNLQESNARGCSECFCSGVSTSCSQSRYSREQIPIYVGIDQVTLADFEGNDTIRDGFQIDLASNEISHRFNAYSTYFWSLPQRFLGNKVKSYGGNLQFILDAQGYGDYIPDQDIIIRGNGVTLVYTRPHNLEHEQSLTVRLYENDRWQKLERTGLQQASHYDFLTVLSDVRHILIRATLRSPTTETRIRNVIMDTAVDGQFGREDASDVEVCNCPLGYEGSSCESCAPLYYRDSYDRNGAFGSCKQCPCNNNAESCSLHPSGQVQCNCKHGYVGDQCQYQDHDHGTTPYPPTPPPPELHISVEVTSPLIQIVESGDTVSLECIGRDLYTQVPIHVIWYKLNGALPFDSYQSQGRLTIQNIQIHDAGIYVCKGSWNDEVVEKNATIHVGSHTPPQVSISPSIIEADEFSTVEAHCTASGIPQPLVSWSRVGGLLPQGVYNRGSILHFISIRLSDAGYYRCNAENPYGHGEQVVEVVVRPMGITPPIPTPPHPTPGIFIEPPYYHGNSGDTVHLICNTEPHDRYDYSWYKDGVPIREYHIVINGNQLLINSASESDTGSYECQAVNIRHGQLHTAVAEVIIHGRGPEGIPPKIHAIPSAQSVAQGEDLTLSCDANGTPYPVIKWTKLHDSFDSNVEQIGNSLIITNAQPNNRGVYICVAENSYGTDQGGVEINVEPRQQPVVEINPRDPQTIREGESAMLSCIAIRGIPQPTITWQRSDRRPFSQRVRQQQGTISFHDATLEEDGEYECRAENIAGYVTAVATLRVQNAYLPPSITIRPEQQYIEVQEGSDLTLTCIASGSPLPMVQWIDQPRPVVYGYPGETEAVLHIHRARSSDSKVYYCEAINDASIDRKSIQVRVVPRRGDIDIDDYTTSAPDWPRPPVHSNQDHQLYTVGLGDSATLICQIENSPFETSWDRIDGHPFPHNSIITGKNLFIEHVDYDANGLYECYINDYDGRKSLVIAEIKVVPIPRITFSPAMPMIVRSGDNVEIVCDATGEQPIHVEWRAENNRPLPHSVIVDHNRLRFAYITPNDAGRYFCTASNTHGQATKVAEVLVNRGQAISRPDQGQTHFVSEGDSVALNCDVHHHQPGSGARINWRREDNRPLTNIEMTNDRLILRNIRYEDQGKYICELKSGNEVISSSQIDVQIKNSGMPNVNLPILQLHPKKEYLHAGESTEVECSTMPGNFANVVWERADGRPLPLNVQQSGNKLIITNASPSDSGDYVCKCLTDHGQIFTNNYELNIEDQKRRPTRTPTVEHAEVGSAVVLLCDSSDPLATYKWTRQHGKFRSDVDTSNARLRLVNVQAKDAGSYICTIHSNGHSADTVTTLVVTGAIPYFPQTPKSYMTFPKLDNAYMKFNFEITFKPESANGLILYNGQKKGSGDYIALSLHDRYPEFRFDFGTGPKIIRSEEPIVLGQWHTIKVNRVRKEGFMIVDNQRPVAFPPTQHFVGLDLIEKMYLGAVPVWEDIPDSAVAHQQGFVGCVSRLILKDVTIELNQDSLFAEGTSSCEPCADNPCRNDGVCLESQTDTGYSCICQNGFTGKNCAVEGFSCTPGICGPGRCEDSETGMECFCPLNTAGDLCQYHDRIEGTSLAFKDGSYAAYKTPRASKLNIKFQVRPDSVEDSVILYVAESETANGDFAAVVIKDRHVELRLNTGARLKTLVIRSQNPIPAQKWTEIQISRKLGEGYLKVGNDPQQSGKAIGPARSMYLKTHLYIGGYDRRILLNKGVEVTRGFHGCISSLEESMHSVNMITEILDAANVQSCGASNEINNSIHAFKPSPSFDSCYTEPCENNGECHANGTTYTCDCPLGFTGKSCEISIQLDMTAHFRGNGYIEINHTAISPTTNQLSSFVAILFSTRNSNGLLLWYGQGKNKAYKGDDFLALAVIDGILEFSFRLNGEESNIRSPDKRVDDGARHVTIIRRTGNQFTLELDGFTYHGESRPTARELMHLPGHLFIGGVVDLSSVTGNRFAQGFDGCIHVIEPQEGKPINLAVQAISGRNVGTCPDDDEDEDDLFLGTDPPVV